MARMWQEMTVMARFRSWFEQALVSTEKTDLYVIENGTLAALRCCNEVLYQFVRLYADAISPEFILMDNHALPHRAHATNDYLEFETIVCMDWPVRSPDLNQIEHAWDNH